MTTTIEIRGMSFFHGDDGRNTYKTLAIAEAYLPELAITMRELRLVWSKDRGYIVFAPSAKGALPLITWFHKGDFARSLTEKIVDMFQRMGGDLPAPKPVIRRDHVTGKPIGQDIFDVREAAISAAKSGEIERRVFPAAWTVIEQAAPNEVCTLGDDPVVETLEKAGL